ncbi:hypothetical protein [Xanthocytophaga flava]|uniref:hypothetical protein n=1 Tax=Xanthocytophaga flava TaxID=3048013 RepID=UPI0028D52E7C|nr:hypothetical protein [Xanthocytophaga flavus]MDJ1470985.1 hypothetical protein [Xanthocytophaga flavus]
MDYYIPDDINTAITKNKAHLGDFSLGKEMFEDSYTYFKNKLGKDLDGIYGEWIKSDAYAAYGGESLNLKKFREFIEKGMSREDAAFETITGKWAKEKGFTKVKFFDDPLEFTDKLPRFDKNNRVEVIFYR